MSVVWKTRVVSRNDILDFGAAIKNVFGGRLRTYEKMIDKGIKEATDELEAEWAAVKNIKIEVTELKNASVCIVAYGEIDDYE